MHMAKVINISSSVKWLQPGTLSLGCNESVTELLVTVTGCKQANKFIINF